MCHGTRPRTDVRAVGAVQVGGLLLGGGAQRLRLARLPGRAVRDVLVLGILCRHLRRRVFLVCLIRRPRSAVVLLLRTVHS